MIPILEKLPGGKISMPYVIICLGDPELDFLIEQTFMLWSAVGPTELSKCRTNIVRVYSSMSYDSANSVITAYIPVSSPRYAYPFRILVR